MQQTIMIYRAIANIGILIMLAGCSGQPVFEQDKAGYPGKNTRYQDQRVSPARHTVIKTAQSMLGIPYRYGGNTPSGFDCSGLVWYSHKKAGINVPRTAAQQMKVAKQISVRNMLAGDLLFFRISGNRNYHVATYLGDSMFIHAPSSGKKVSTDSLNNPYWKKRLVRTGNFYR